MSTPPTPTTKSRREARDTGFPEPFCNNYNTTLPHPDADLSPNAVISGESLSLDNASRRRKMSMLHKHRRTISQNSSESTSQTLLVNVLSAVNSQMPGATAAAPAVIRPSSSANGSIGEEGTAAITTSAQDSEMRPTSPEASEPSSPRSKMAFFRGWRSSRG